MTREFSVIANQGRRKKKDMICVIHTKRRRQNFFFNSDVFGISNLWDYCFKISNNCILILTISKTCFRYLQFIVQWFSSESKQIKKNVCCSFNFIFENCLLRTVKPQKLKILQRQDVQYVSKFTVIHYLLFCVLMCFNISMCQCILNVIDIHSIQIFK